MRRSVNQEYEKPPAPEMHRFLISVETFTESWPETSFHYWETGGGCEYRLKPSLAGMPSTEGLPDRTDIFGSNIADLEVLEDFDQFYAPGSMLCMLIDARDEAAAWLDIEGHFPDLIRRFCKPADAQTLSTISYGGGAVL
jgi:hypothetical protein